MTNKKKLYWIIFVAFIISALFALLAETPLGDSPLFIAGLGVCFVIIVICVFITLPYFYKKKLEERSNRSLRSFIVADPEMRELLMSQKTPSPQGPKAPAAQPAAPKPEPQKPRPSPPRPPAKK
jgi:hypothetical protein